VLDLFWRCVRRRPGKPASRERLRRAVGPRRDTETDDDDAAVGRDEQLSRLDLGMNHARIMGG